MTFDERISWLILGLLIGFVIGYITAVLHRIERTVDEVDNIVTKQRDERGFMRYPLLADATLLIIVLLTVWASFQSQRVSNEVQDTQEDQQRVTVCTQQYLTKTIQALNERTEYTAASSLYNVELQKAQAAFLRLTLKEPPLSSERIEDGLRDYVNSLTEFVDISAQTRAKQLQYPYPTEDEFENCVAGTKEKNNE